MASLSLKFKFPVTIALNFGFFQFKALKIFQFSGQVNSRQKFCLQLFSSQGLESLEPFNFFQVKALNAQANLEKTRSWFLVQFTYIIQFSDAYLFCNFSTSLCCFLHYGCYIGYHALYSKRQSTFSK